MQEQIFRRFHPLLYDDEEVNSLTGYSSYNEGAYVDEDWICTIR
jgi:hypothetical protein